MQKMARVYHHSVRIGRVPGVYSTRAEREAQTKNFSGATYKKMTSAEAAKAFKHPSVLPPSSASRAVVVTPSASETRDEPGYIIVYCDGACKGNGQSDSAAGIGVWWGHDDPRNISERCPGDQTNNRAELIAIVRILETTPHLKRPLLIKTDSNYSIQCVTEWIFKWMKNDFLTADGKPVKNRALIQYLATLLHTRQKAGQSVKFQHVRGHAGIEGNEAADQLASLGSTKPIIPERNWEKLEKQARKSAEPAKTDFKAYADGLLNDDILADSLDSSLPERRPPCSEDTSASLSKVARVPATKLTCGKDSLPFNSSSEPITASLRLAPPTKNSTSKEEIEMFASCLLDDDDLSTLGRDGAFDSDF